MSELIHNLGIDSRVILAQIINFAILLFVLKKFAYKPILKILDERRERIEEAIRRSQSVDRQMAEIEALKEKVLMEARQRSEEIIKKAEEAARKVQEAVLEEAHSKSERFLAESEKKIQTEREKIFQEVKNEIAVIVAAAVEKVTEGVFDKETQKRMAEEALRLINVNK